MDRDGFKSACVRILGAQPPKNGIGTYSEKTLHAVLKHYCDPNAQKHEIKIGPFVADIADEEGIIEIQTAGFNRLRRKLEAFLADSQVTVVYPIAQTKWLIWIDETTGEITKRRKSPKKGTPCDIFRELYRIKPLLKTPNLTIRVVLLEIEEYRYLNGWSKDRKKGSSRCDRIPLDLAGELFLHGPGDYGKLIPSELTKRFTTKDFKSAAGVSLRVLVEVNVGMNRCGVEPGEPALALARFVAETRGLRFMGLQGYEGHLVMHPNVEERRAKALAAMG
jgi:hypothetical protein